MAESTAILKARVTLWYARREDLAEQIQKIEQKIAKAEAVLDGDSE